MTSINSPLGRLQNAQNTTQQPQRKTFVVDNQEPVQSFDQQKFDQNFPYQKPSQPGSFINGTFSNNIPESLTRELTLEEENNVKKAREAKRKGLDLSDEARNRVKHLTEICRSSTEVNVDGTIFVLRSLKGKELKDMAFSLSQFNGSSNFSIQLETRSQVLARSLYTIDGISFELVLGSNKIEEKIAFIDELEEDLQQLLHDAYGKMTKENSKKYGVHSKEEAKEFSDDVKKS
jgi:hypothetical protein